MQADESPEPEPFHAPGPGLSEGRVEREGGEEAGSGPAVPSPYGRSPRTGVMGASLFTQLTVAAFLVAIPMLFPQQLIPKMMYSVIPIADSTDGSPAAAETSGGQDNGSRRRRQLNNRWKTPKVAKLFAPRIEAPKPKPAHAVETPAVNAAFAPAANPIAAPG